MDKKLAAKPRSASRRPVGKRRAPRSFTFFNHKGGVGKTVITANVCFALAEQGYSVLAVDADPQCNLSTYLLKTSILSGLLESSDSAKGGTMWSAVRGLCDATGDLRSVEPIRTSAKNLYLLAGDLRLATFEEALAQNWPSLWARSRLALRQFTAVAQLVREAALKVNADYVLYDLGPNIGALNRSVLLGCDAFAVPILRDVFSRSALGTLAQSIVAWTADWENLTSLLPESAQVLAGAPMLAGYIVGDYTSYPGLNKSYDESQIQADVNKKLVGLLKGSRLIAPRRTLSSMRLGSIGNHGAGIVSAIHHNAALWRMPGSGAAEARNEFFRLTEKLVQELGRG